MPASAPFILTSADIPRYIELRRLMLRTDPHAYGSHPDTDGALDPAVMQGRLTGGFNSIAAIEDGESLIASAGVFREPTPKVDHRAVLWGVYVHPDHRGRGHGRSVVRRAIDIARAWDGVDTVLLSVSTGAPAALAMYLSLGFVRWGTEPEVVDIDGTRYGEHHLRLVLR